MSEWGLYRGSGTPRAWNTEELPEPPGWRRFTGTDTIERPLQTDPHITRRLGEAAQAARYPASQREIDMINAALFLRRPLLISGKPGTGKSTLAYAVAHELMLGPVLRWPISTRSTLQEGLYRYDAVARLQEAHLKSITQGRNLKRRFLRATPSSVAPDEQIGRFVRLGPLGTALLPTKRPRVLLIDEIDKSDIDLPNDLLDVFEEGEYEIPELNRLPKEHRRVYVRPSDGEDLVPIEYGVVRCAAFPLVILTSNSERDFPPAFFRRCLRLDIETPKEDKLKKIVEAHLGTEVLAQIQPLLDEFIEQRDENNKELSPDQLLNAIYLVTHGIDLLEQNLDELRDSIFRNLAE